MIKPNLTMDVIKHVLDKFFERVEEGEEKPSLAGLALSLGVSPATLFKIEELEDEDERAPLLIEAKTRIARHYEEDAMEKKNTKFNVFMLKALGYPNNVQLDLTSGGQSLAALAEVANQKRQLALREAFVMEKNPIHDLADENFTVISQ